jgi:hypothetical protein
MSHSSYQYYLRQKIKKQIKIKKHERKSVGQLFRHLTELVTVRSMEQAALRIVQMHSSTPGLFHSYLCRMSRQKRAAQLLFHWAAVLPRPFTVLLCMVEMRRLIYERRLLLLNWTLAQDTQCFFEPKN